MSEPDQRKTSLGVIFLILFFDLLGFSVVFPLFPAILRHFGEQGSGLLGWVMDFLRATWPAASTGQREVLFGGLLVALYAMLQFWAAPLWGALSDRWGRRPILLFSSMGHCLAYLLWIFAGSFELFVLSRVIAGVMGANLGAATAAVADISSERERGRAMGLIGAAFGLGFIVGPCLGGLAYHFSPAIEGGTCGLALNPFSMPALAAFALGLANLLWIWRRFAETLPPERRGKSGAVRTADPRRLFAHSLGPGIVRLNVAYLVFTVLFAGWETTLAFVVQDLLAYEPVDTGLLFGWMGIVSAFVQGYLVRRLLHRHGERRLALLGFAASVPGFALIAALCLHASTPLLVLGVAVLALGTGFAIPTLTAMVSLLTDAQRQGTVLGIFRSVGSLGRAIGPLLGALLYFAWGPSGPYLCGAVVLAIPIALIARLPAERGAQSR